MKNKSLTDLDIKYLNYAVKIAKKANANVLNNPNVGAVIVKNNQIIGEGYHQIYGQAHAEVNAINSAKQSVEGATIYVTLEPCSHFGKTPPCANLIVKSKIARVVIGCLDVNPIVRGNGVKVLIDNNVDVLVANHQPSIDLIEDFRTFFVKQRPYIALKSACSLDGKIATHNGESKWITNEKSRQFAQKMRSKYQAIGIGINTLLCDDPILTNRMDENDYQPQVIVFDSQLKTPTKAKIFLNSRKVIILTTIEKSTKRYSANTKIITVAAKNNQIDLQDAFKKLYDQKIKSILIEGGGTLIGKLISNNLFDELNYFLAPKLLGNSQFLNFQLPRIEKLSDVTKFKITKILQIDNDIYIKYRRQSCLPE